MIYVITVYDDFGPKIGLVVMKHLVLLGIESLEAQWSPSFKSISEVKDYSDWNNKATPPPHFGNPGS